MKYIRGCVINQIEIADYFYEAYKRCMKPDKDNHIVAIPAFVNGLFASELYLKVLLGDKEKNIKNHNLKKLYESLDEKYIEELKSIKCDSRYTLESLLDNIGDGFIMWRYIFEDDNDNFGNGRPFEYSEYFLNAYLPVLKDMAHIYKQETSIKKSIKRCS